MMVARVGAWGISVIQEMGRMLLFVLSSFAWLTRPPLRFVQIVKQLHFIGYKSTFVVVLTDAAAATFSRIRSPRASAALA